MSFLINRIIHLELLCIHWNQNLEFFGWNKECIPAILNSFTEITSKKIVRTIRHSCCHFKFWKVQGRVFRSEWWCNTLRKKGAKRVLSLSHIWNPLWFLKEPLKILEAPWGTFVGTFPVYTIEPLKVPQRVLGFSATLFEGSRARVYTGPFFLRVNGKSGDMRIHPAVHLELIPY